MVEMLIVISIVSILLLLIIPNINEKQKMISEKGCEALKETITSQMFLYELKYNEIPKKIDDLINKGFINKEQSMCNNGKQIEINNGSVFIK